MKTHFSICKVLFSFFLLSLTLHTSFTSIAYSQEDKGNRFIDSTKSFINLLINNDFDAIFKKLDPDMQKALSIQKIKSVWENVVKQYGNFKEFKKASINETGDNRLIVQTCAFDKEDLNFVVSFNLINEVSGWYIQPKQKNFKYLRPTYVDTTKFLERDVTIGNDEWQLPGKLTVPNVAGKYPVLILVHGSGPNDKDESILGNMPFRDLAWGLSTKGIAVFRYEKRTKKHGLKFMSVLNTFTVKDEVTDDVQRAVEAMKKEQDIDSSKIFVLGHSLGGYLIPRIGNDNPTVKGLISMAGAARPLEDLFWEQVNYIFKLDGSISAEEQTYLDTIKIQVENVKNLSQERFFPSYSLVLNLPATYWMDLKGYNPAETAKLLFQPLLFIQGERDYQVTLEDFGLWKKSLSGKSNVEFKLYPKLNHLFHEGEGKSTPSEYEKQSSIPEYIIDDLLQWILNTCKK